MWRVEQAQGTYGDDVALVTVSYSSGGHLDRFLDTLSKATTRPLPVVVVDNGSTDGSPEQAARRDGVRVLRVGDNVGYGAAANHGIAELDDGVGWVVLANPDIEWEPNAIDTLLDATERWPAGGSFGPLIKDPDGSTYPSARMLPSMARGVGHALFCNVWPGNPWTKAYRQEGREPVERTAGWLSGSCLLLRREAFDDVGGFDHGYFMYFEDVDLGDRLGRAGWANVYVPSATVTHLLGHATSRDPVGMLAAHHASAYRYIADRHRGMSWLPVRALVRLGLAARLKVASRRVRG